MDKQLNNFLIKTGLTQDEIEYMKQVAPGLDVVDTDSAISCVKAVVDAGFPTYEIDYLIFENPNILLYSIEELIEKLEKIGDEIETVLKDDPHII